MKKILIISFYFPPCNGTPSPRPHSWAKEFAKSGYDVTVVTRHWTEGGSDWKDYIASTVIDEPILEEKEGYKVWSLPYKKFSYPKNTLVAKVDTLANLLLGNLERGADTMQFYPFLKTELSKNRYDSVSYTHLTLPTKA